LLHPHTLRITVAEAFPNCPKYIQRRTIATPVDNLAPRPSAVGDRLGAEEEAIIRQSDTMFVASRHPRRGVDASHRGGASSFIEIVDATHLRIPDYKGNAMFNTLGNLAVTPAVALSIVSFAQHRVLDITGTATIREAAPTQGTTGLTWEVAITGFRTHDLPS